MKNKIKKLLKKVIANKLILVGVVIVLVLISYFISRAFTGTETAVSYVYGEVSKGSLISSISGTGQVLAFNEFQIKPKASGDVVYVGVKNGQAVKSGDLIAQLDSSDAQKSVRDAEMSLASAKLSFEKFIQPADELSLLQANNTLTQAQESKDQAEEDLTRTYEDGFNKISSAFLDLPTVITGLNNILFGNTYNSNQSNVDYYINSISSNNGIVQYKDSAVSAYQRARESYDQSFQDYKLVSRFSSTTEIESLVDETYETIKAMSDAVKSADNLIQFYKDKLGLIDANKSVSSLVDTALANINSYTSKTNTHLSNIFSVKTSISDDKQAIIIADRSIVEKTKSLENLIAGPDKLDIQTQELSIEQKQNSLLDAKEKLADYFIRAPFSGIIGGFSLKKGDSVSSGTAIASVITDQKIAEITLNEVDVSKIKIGQKAIMSFDAIDDFSITGEVADMDVMGTVNQGVVSYNVRVSFDVKDERIKSGMSVSVSIITESKQDVLLVPIGAVKSNSGGDYVEMMINGVVIQQTIKTGLSNDTSIEVLEGLNEGDEIIIQTKNNTTAINSTSNQQNPMRDVMRIGR